MEDLRKILEIISVVFLAGFQVDLFAGIFGVVPLRADYLIVGYIIGGAAAIGSFICERAELRRYEMS